MKCKDCRAKNGEEICLIGKKCRMLVCGHYGCDLQARIVEKRMGSIKPLTKADAIRTMTDEALAEYHAVNCGCPQDPIIRCRLATTGCISCWLDYLRQVAEKGE